jgi:hypothetical protein
MPCMVARNKTQRDGPKTMRHMKPRRPALWSPPQRRVAPHAERFGAAEGVFVSSDIHVALGKGATDQTCRCLPVVGGVETEF